VFHGILIKHFVTYKIMIHQKRRISLLKQLDDNAVVIISTNPQQQRSGDTSFPFRPNSNFYYLTGFKEPEAVAVFSNNNYTIFLRPKDKEREIWDGKRLGVDDAPKALNADKSHSINMIQELITDIIEKDCAVFFDPDSNEIDSNISEALTNHEFKSVIPYINEMRLFKDSNEISLMKKSANISVKAHELAMKKTKPGLHEYEVQSIFDGHFIKNNSVHAYSPIVAGGENACVLHYTENNKTLNDGDLVLIDAGCEFECYASDITRTFPVCGSFSRPQKEIYQIVLDAQIAAINSIRPGAKVSEPHQITTKIIREGLIGLGILESDGDLSQFFMHGTGHWIGLDVHDVGDYKLKDEHRTFQKGMVITVEPGIYIGNNDKINPIYHNIGVRIEDDVFVTDNGNTVLTADLIKEITDIESIMNN
jgi:Xaa-Pro aminopeptidase